MTSLGAPPGKAALDPHTKTSWFFFRPVVRGPKLLVSSCAAHLTTIECERFVGTGKRMSSFTFDLRGMAARVDGPLLSGLWFPFLFIRYAKVLFSPVRERSLHAEFPP